MRILITALALLIGCGDEDPGAEEKFGPPADCEVTVNQRYAPASAEELESFPDDIMMVEDASSPTGLRIETSSEKTAWIDHLPEVIEPVAVDLNGLSGFGSNSDMILRFDAPLEPLAREAFSATEGPLSLYDLSTDPPTAVAIRVYVFEEGRALRIRSVRPLRLGAQHILVLSHEVRGADGGCVAPSPFLGSLMGRTEADEGFASLSGRYKLALDRLELHPLEVVAATLFTIHRDVEDVVAIARDVQERTVSWLPGTRCDDQRVYVHCEATFTGLDFRGTHGLDTQGEPTPWTLPVSIFLPLEATSAAPLVFFAHGLNDDRYRGASLAQLLAPLGYAVVSAETTHHGAHPTADPNSTLPALDFLGLDIASRTVDALGLRNNMDQTNLDRLMLLRLLELEPDIDGDGDPDIDMTRVAYYGASLGGMLGPQLMALSPAIEAGVFAIAGGRLLDFVTGTQQVEAFRPLLITLFGSEERFERLLPVGQSIVDASDPATWAAHVLEDRLMAPDHRPHVLMSVAIEDDTVPPETGKAMARALDVPHLGPVLDPVDSMTRQTAPATANHLDGAVTAGFFQFDRISSDEGIIAATHGNLPLSEEGFLQTVTFFDTWRDETAPTIIDPYAERQTGPLPADP